MRVGAMLVIVCLLGCGDGGGGGGDPADAGATDDAAESTETLTVTTYIGNIQRPLVWVAVQDGDGPYRTITSVDGEYTIELENDRWGLAYVCQGTNFSELSLFNATLDEFRSIIRACRSEDQPPQGTLQVEVTGLDSNGAASVGVAGTSSSLSMVSPSLFVPTAVGAYEVAVAIKPDGTAIERIGLFTATVNESVTTTVSVPAATAGAPVGPDHTITVTNAEAPAQLFSTLLTAGGSAVALNQGTEGAFAPVPSSLLRAGDLHRLFANEQMIDDGTTRVRETDAFLHDPADVELTLPDPVSITVSLAQSVPQVRFALTFAPVTGAELYSFEGSVEDGTTFLEWKVTAGWLGSGASHELTQPDLTAVDGWLDEFGLQPGPRMSWGITSYQTDGDSSPLEHIERGPASGPYVLVGDWDGEQMLLSGRLGELVP